MSLLKYPRTRHLVGSRLQEGDEDLEAVPFETIQGRHLVVEEKVDGANAAVSFDESGRLLLQSRGHFLTGGPREAQFDLLKAWATRHQGRLAETLGSRYVMYGEWLYARHTVYYDALPHYFLEFDVRDRETGDFLSTPRRRELLRGLAVTSVPVRHEGPLRSRAELTDLVGRSSFKSPAWKDSLAEEALARGLDVSRTLAEADPSDLMEGLYVKVEEGGVVVERLKWVRAEFLATILDAGSHLMDRPLLPNRLAKGVDLFAEASS